MAKRSSKKFRTDFRKNRSSRVRDADLTRQFARDEINHDRLASAERLSGKGDLTRKRTIHGAAEGEEGELQIDVDRSECLQGRVLRVRGLISEVQIESGAVYQCATRRLLKTLSTDQRHVVAAGDLVWFRPADNQEGIIESVEPRYGVLCRASK
ncbi:MAG: ribosome small subunit-dependent GTPase A, partial [Blastopirellula sp. JB062]